MNCSTCKIEIQVDLEDCRNCYGSGYGYDPDGCLSCSGKGQIAIYRCWCDDEADA